MSLALVTWPRSTELAPSDPLMEQAQRARLLGSEFVAQVLEAASRNLERAPLTGLIVTTWSGDPASGAVALRLNAALHALARSGRHAELTELYRTQTGPADGIVGAVLEADDSYIAGWLLDVPQTNEVARSAALAAALLEIQARTGADCELLELGASSGLNLNLARYTHRLGGTTTGDPRSSVKIEPAWRGQDPCAGELRLAAARGVDLNPVDLNRPDARERLIAFVWADQPRRIARLIDAIALAERHAPEVIQGRAGQWLIQALAAPQMTGRCRIVYHSMFAQYLSRDERAIINQALADAAGRASPDRPLAKIGFEWNGDRSQVWLTLSLWPEATCTLLATCHPYGEWIDWEPRPIPQSWAI